VRHRWTSAVRSNCRCALQGELAIAKEYISAAVRVKELHYGVDHMEVSRALASLGKVHGLAGELVQSVGCLKRAVQIKESCYGSFRPLGLSPVTFLSLSFLSALVFFPTDHLQATMCWFLSARCLVHSLSLSLSLSLTLSHTHTHTHSHTHTQVCVLWRSPDQARRQCGYDGPRGEQCVIDTKSVHRYILFSVPVLTRLMCAQRNAMLHHT
jgi:hypothetical protein